MHLLLASGSGNIYRVFQPHSGLLHIIRHVRCDEIDIPGYGNPLTQNGSHILAYASGNPRSNQLLVDLTNDAPSIEGNDSSSFQDADSTTVDAGGSGIGADISDANCSGSSSGAQLPTKQDQDLFNYTPASPRRSARVADMPPESLPNYDERSDDDEFVDTDGDDQATDANPGSVNFVTIHRNGKTRRLTQCVPDSNRPSHEGSEQCSQERQHP